MPCFALLLALAAATDLERCRAADLAFDSATMVEACATAAANPELDNLARSEALRRLALAHALNGDEEIAEATLVRMLVLVPRARLPTDAGPRLEALMERARHRLATEGRLEIEVRAPDDREGGGPLDLFVVDRLGRVRSAELLVVLDGTPRDVVLERSDEAPGRLSFRAALPAGARQELRWRVTLRSWDGAEIDQRDGTVGAVAPAPAAAGNVGPSEVFGWTLVASGASLALVGSTLAAIVANALYFERVPCGNGTDSVCVPQSVFFGRYGPAEREVFFNSDGPMMLNGALAMTSLGVLLTIGGVTMLVAAPSDAADEAP